MSRLTPVVYPVNDTSRSEAEREYLAKLAHHASTQDLSQDMGPYVRNMSIAFTVFAAVFVSLRFLARWRQAARILIDDWLIVASLVVLAGNMVMNIMLVELGLGRHSGSLTLPELQRLDQTIVGAEIIYVTGVNLYKISLLFFYFRIFPVRQVRLGGYICGGISTAWQVACMLAATFQCTPRERLWSPWLPGTCINLFLTQLCISVPSILCDIAILCLPMPHVLRLKTTLTQRVLLIFIFMLGSYVVFTSIYRFRIFLQYTTDDVPYSLADGCAWNIIEISSGVVSACLPTLGPLFRVFKSGWPSTAGAKSAEPSQKNGSAIMTIGGGSTGPGTSRWKRLNESDENTDLRRDELKYGLELVPKNQSGRVEVNVRASPTRMNRDTGNRGGDRGSNVSLEGSGDEYPLTAIRQRTDVEWHVENTGSGPKTLDTGLDRGSNGASPRVGS